jgi:hypothetical protein
LGGPAVELHTDRGEVAVRKAGPDEPPFAPRSLPGFGKGRKQPQPPQPLKRLEQ